MSPLRLVLAASCATPALMSVGPAAGASYFCSPAPIKLGSYDDVDIQVSLPGLSPFWFDDQTGDYMSYADGVAGQVEPAKVPVPLSPRLSTKPGSPASFEDGVTITFYAGQCVLSPIGVVPTMVEGAPA